MIDQNKLKEYRKQYRLKNKERIKAYAKQYRQTNKKYIKEYKTMYYVQKQELMREYRNRIKEKNKEYHKLYRQKNKEVLTHRTKRYYQENATEIKDRTKKYYEKNKEVILKKGVLYNNKRRKTDPIFKLISQLRNTVNKAFRRKKFIKNDKAQIILGATFEVVINYLKHTAINNYGFYDDKFTYHVDHVKPLKLANTELEVYKLNHYTNLQLLTPEDNLKKGSKYLDNKEQLEIGDIP